MTKVTILAPKPVEKKPKNIEFLKHLDDGKFIPTGGAPNNWQNVVLLPFKINQLDVFACFDKADYLDSGFTGNIFLGHFNDGIV